MTKLTFYSDGGHGWLKVSKKQLRQLGIENQISSYSYMRNDFAYLEEDCDLSVFMVALGKTKNIDMNDCNSDAANNFRNEFWLNTNKHDSNKLSKIRNYDSYEIIPENITNLLNEFKKIMLNSRKFSPKGVNRINRANLRDCQYWNQLYDLGFDLDV